MTTKPAALPPIRIFLSYAHSDNEIFPFAEPLKKMLEQMIESTSGRPAEVFFDRKDISLGENWERVIEGAIDSSTFFLAAYSATYIQRDQCRREFIDFRLSSERTDTEKLLIPITLFGLKSLKPAGEDSISDYVRDHQAADLSNAWIEGADSAPFRAAVSAIVERVISATEEIEEALSQVEESVASFDANPHNEGESSDDEDGFIELGATFTETLEKLTAESEELSDAITGLADLPKPPDPQSGNSLATASRYMIQAAMALKDPALRIESSGEKILSLALSADRDLRKMLLLATISRSEGLELDVTTIFAGVDRMSELDPVVTQLQSLLDSMKTPEIMSASVRKSLRPARNGITAVQDALRVVAQWSDAVNSMDLR